jgi:hypothetical protein
MNHTVPNNFSEHITSLSAGTLSTRGRAALVDAILTNSETARLTKLSLRLAEPARHAASAMLLAAAEHKTPAWRSRSLLTGACASLAMVAVFSFTAMRSNHTASQNASINAANDRFGPIASFEGAAPAFSATITNLDLNDHFGEGGFEAN